MFTDVQPSYNLTMEAKALVEVTDIVLQNNKTATVEDGYEIFSLKRVEGFEIPLEIMGIALLIATILATARYIKKKLNKPPKQETTVATVAVAGEGAV